MLGTVDKCITTASMCDICSKLTVFYIEAVLYLNNKKGKFYNLAETISFFAKSYKSNSEKQILLYKG